MKILVMVLSCMKHPYDKLYQTQVQTFDSIEVEDVDTYFYFGDEYELMHVAFREALKEVWYNDWDVIFRTNSSTYVNKVLLKEFLKNRDTRELWIGDEIGYNSGAGFIVSRDLAKILMDEIPSEKRPYEDLLCQEILNSKGYICECGQRCNYDHHSKSFFDCYNIRVKSNDIKDVNRTMDVYAMQHIHDKYK